MDIAGSGNGTAVVIGASVGGVLAARALTDTFKQVIVLDRDTLPEDPVERRGAAQAYHSHFLLVRGREIFEELFPGITDELLAQGAIPADMHRQVVFYAEGRRLAPAPSDLRILAVSRPLLETRLRRRLAALPGVTIRDRMEVTGLTATGDRTRVTGVRGQQVGGGEVEEIAADLVVDASGRSNRCVAWLADLGYDAPAEQTVKSGIVYATQQFHRDPDDERIAVAVGLSPDSPRGAAAIAAEGDRWICTLVATPGQEAPADTETFAAYADTLAAPDIGVLARTGKPVSDVVVMRLPANFWRRFDKAARLPERFLAFGDALCFLNATYAQGMTVAAAEALVLRDCLATGLDDIARRFFQEVRGVVAVPWQMSAGADLRFPWVEGDQSRADRIVSAYMTRLLNQGADDARLNYAFLRVMNMLAQPQSLFRPSILFRVLRPRRAAA